MREPRLGDDIDDFCVRCKRITNHAVVSVVNHEPAKVRCRTCHSDHDYRHEQAPPPKVDLRKQALFNEVLKKVNPDGVGKASEIADVPDLAELDDGPDEADADAEVDADAEAEEAEVEEAPPPPPPTPKPKAKAAKGKSRK
ncbi:MAG TPA: hypothetical protein VGZ73_20315 [Bryobacteraceae bacterium]|jgi:hypothetical protein|nr:hypothetical protein [Bryobacteraceae bacterium]